VVWILNVLILYLITICRKIQILIFIEYVIKFYSFFFLLLFNILGCTCWSFWYKRFSNYICSRWKWCSSS
jgi:hypothetical protein